MEGKTSIIRRETASLQRIDFVNEFLKYKRIEADISDSTQTTYRLALRQLQKFLDDNIINAPTLPDLQRWKEMLRNKGLSVSGINSYLITAKQFFRFMNDRGYYPNDCHMIKAVKTRSHVHKKGHIKTEWFIKMISCLDDSTIAGKRDRCILLLKYLNGLRDIEIKRLTHGDLKQIDGGYELHIQGKGRREKEAVYIIRTVANALNDYKRHLKTGQGYDLSGPMFASFSNRAQGKPISTAYIRQMIGTLLGRLVNDGIISPDTRANLSGHSLRHGFATNCINSGLDLRTVQKSMRHRDYKTTLIYIADLDTRQAWDQVRESQKPMIDKLESLFNHAGDIFKADSAPAYCFV